MNAAAQAAQRLDGRSSRSPGRRTKAIALAVISLVLLADWLVIDRPIGCSIAVLTLVVLSLTLLGGGLHRRPSVAGPAQAGVVLGVVLLAGTMVLEPRGLAAGLCVVGLWTLATWSRHGAARSAARWLRRMVLLPAALLAQPLGDVSRIHRATRHRARRWTLSGEVGRWAIPIIAAIAFVGLFALANPILARMLDRGLAGLFEDARALLDSLSGPRVVLWIAIGTFSWVLLRPRVAWMARGIVAGGPTGERPTLPEREPDHALPDHQSTAPRPADVEGEAGLARRRLPLGVTTPGFAWRALLLFNLAFAVQSSLDAVYLLGGAALPEGMTYASYAHRGAYPLIAAAVLAGLFTLAVFRPSCDWQAMRPARLLLVPWIAQSVFLTVTAGWRLWLYVDAYGLSRWRLAAAIWMALVAGGLALVAARSLMRRSNDWLLRRTLVMVVAVLSLCCVPDWEGLIARHNVRHCRELSGDAAPLDLVYLEAMGPAALPAIAWLEARTEGRSDVAAMRGELVAMRGRLVARLEAQLADWRGWTIRRATLMRAVRQTP